MRILTFALCFLCFSVSAQIDWDFPYNPDSDNDGYIYSEDLLDLLSVYGQEYSSDELYLSQDSSSLIVKIAESINKVECISSCISLDGSWRLAHIRDAMHFLNVLTAGLDPYNEEIGGIELYQIEYMWMDRRDEIYGVVMPEQVSLTMKNAQTASADLQFAPLSQSISPGNVNLPERNKSECWCVTHQRPRVEYKMFNYLSNDVETEELVNTLSQEGWRLMPAMNGSGEKVTMWRWAE